MWPKQASRSLPSSDSAPVQLFPLRQPVEQQFRLISGNLDELLDVGVIQEQTDTTVCSISFALPSPKLGP